MQSVAELFAGSAVADSQAGGKKVRIAPPCGASSVIVCMIFVQSMHCGQKLYTKWRKTFASMGALPFCSGQALR
jgi:hypothetical protein